MSNREINEIKYLGIISGISKEIGLVTEIDKLVPRGGKVSVGEATLAMILNGMGLTMSKPIYLVQNYFKGKPLDLLVGKGIESKHLNDDFLGRALDALAEKGLDSIFSKIAFKAVEHYKIQIKNLNGDITNMQLMGEYDDSELVKFGYPKHGRADLKQFLLSLITTDDGAIPLFIKIFQGNTAEPNHYNELLQLLKENLKNLDDSYFTMDCAGFTEKNLKTADGLNIVTRVPDKIVGVKELKKTYMLAPNRLIGEGNNKFVEVGSIYGDTNQRWVLVYSKQANERAKKTIERNIEKEKKQYEKFIEKITKQRFACEKDAKEIIARDFKKMQFHRLNNIEITKESDSSEFRAKMQLEKHLEAIQKRIWDSSTFVLSTTQLDAAKLPTSAVLSHYKTQSPLEGRFNLLKNAQCIASNFYVKNDNRIAALAMVMCLCILIYSLTERQLRKALSESNKTVPNQKGKRIKNPTMKWVYSMFEAIYIEVSRHKDKITYTIFNLTDELVEILKSLGQECMKIYGLAA